MFDLPALEAATRLVHAAMPPTPQYAWSLLTQRAGCEVWVKHENHTPTGAFKVRGGLVYLDRLRRERPQVRGLVTATRGNHGQSLPYAARGTGVGVTVCVPHGNSAEKNAAMRALGAELVEFGADFDEARERGDDRVGRAPGERVGEEGRRAGSGQGGWGHELSSLALVSTSSSAAA